jgi:DNA (cytosine-5)-methyltransferase 1
MRRIGLERYFVEEGRVVRQLTVAGHTWRSAIENLADEGEVDFAAWWQSFLRGGRSFPDSEITRVTPLRTVDVFSGCGGLTLGASLAAAAVGRSIDPVAAMDLDEGALRIHQENFGTKLLVHSNASSLVDFHVDGSGASSRFAYTPELIDDDLSKELGSVDLFLAGPPCQGHSNLNNKTRREDPRNLLYITATALAIALRAPLIVIENVPDVLSDRSDVVSVAKALLSASGYTFVDSGVVAAHEIGWAQTRKRHFLIASKHQPTTESLTLKQVAEGLQREPLNVGWAINDLMGGATGVLGVGVMDSVPVLSEENRARVSWLFENDAYELPNEERPNCHRDGHSYPSVYGRMFWDKPAQTITTGFMTPGRGRYIHPRYPRVITPHEAARIQGFPDTFKFVVDGQDPWRNEVSKWIGDAVPSVLGYAAVLPLLVQG